MAVAGRNGQIRLWNVTTGALERDIASSRQRIRALAFSPDGKRLAAAGDDVMIHVVDLTSGGADVSLTARPAKVYAALFLNNETLATGGSDDRICVWDLATRSVTKELVGHTGSVAALACDSTGTMLVSGGYDTTLRIWDLKPVDPQPSVARSPGEAAR
jgi:WD40 repeat protein